MNSSGNDEKKADRLSRFQLSSAQATVIVAVFAMLGVAIGHILTSQTAQHQTDVNAAAQIEQQGKRLRHEIALQKERQTHEIKLEQQRFVQQTISAVIGKGTEEQQRQALRFYAKIGIIGEPYSSTILGLPLEQLPAASAVRTTMPPDLNGFIVYVSRTHVERRGDNRRLRTVGRYKVTFEGNELTGLRGATYESRGPGDNTSTGRRLYRRLETGAYPLHTWRGPKYVTLGYSTNDNIRALPRPGILIGDTGDRSAILIHPGIGFLSAIGTINLSRPLDGPEERIDYQESRNRVIELIDAMREKLDDAFPAENGERIPNAWVIITGEPVPMAESAAN